MASRIFNFNLVASYQNSSWMTNHLNKRHDGNWNLYASINASLNSRNKISFVAYLSPGSLPTSTMNDLMIRQTELKWIEGNFDLKRKDTKHLSFFYQTFPSGKFTFNTTINYENISNEAFIDFRKGDIETGGIVGNYMNAGSKHEFNFYAVPHLRLINNSLSVNCELNYHYFNYPSLHTDLSHVRLRPSISYTFGNNRIWANYLMPFKDFANGGTQKIKNEKQLQPDLCLRQRKF